MSPDELIHLVTRLQAEFAELGGAEALVDRIASPGGGQNPKSPTVEVRAAGRSRMRRAAVAVRRLRCDQFKRTWVSSYPAVVSHSTRGPSARALGTACLSTRRAQSGCLPGRAGCRRQSRVRRVELDDDPSKLAIVILSHGPTLGASHLHDPSHLVKETHRSMITDTGRTLPSTRRRSSRRGRPGALVGYLSEIYAPTSSIRRAAEWV